MTDLDRIGFLAQWIVRDAHEADKVVAYAQEIVTLIKLCQQEVKEFNEGVLEWLPNRKF